MRNFVYLFVQIYLSIYPLNLESFVVSFSSFIIIFFLRLLSVNNVEVLIVNFCIYSIWSCIISVHIIIYHILLGKKIAEIIVLLVQDMDSQILSKRVVSFLFFVLEILLHSFVANYEMRKSFFITHFIFISMWACRFNTLDSKVSIQCPPMTLRKIARVK